MKIEVHLLNIDELALGINCCYGEDEHGTCHMTVFGFLIFSISIIKYL